MHSPYFLPAGTRIKQHLLNLQHERRTCSLVVDEYGDYKGLVTPEEILEAIPEPGTRIFVSGYPVEVVRTRGTGVDIARIQPAIIQ